MLFRSSTRVPFVPADRRCTSPTELSATRARARVAAVRRRGLERNGGVLNAEIAPNALVRTCRLERASSDWLAATIDRLRLSLRAHHRILRVARTVADLDGSEEISRTHLARALAYREPDRAAADYKP